MRSNGKDKLINRSLFLKSSALFTAAYLTPGDIWSRSFGKGEAFYESLRVYKETIESWETPILKAIQAGLAAPSPHNTQPWKFKLLNNSEAHLYVDPERLLIATDPPARQIMIGQGTFLNMSRIGSSLVGIHVHWELFPGGQNADVIAGKIPVAKIIARNVESVNPDQLAGSIPGRMTDRTPYTSEKIPDEICEKLRKGAGAYHSRLELIDDERIGHVGNFIKDAYEIETLNYSRHEESRKWFRYNDEEIYTRRDGISLRGVGLTGVKLWIAGTFFLSPGEESWHSEENKKYGIKSFAGAVDSTTLFALLITEQNTMKDWLLTGMDYLHLQLYTTALGLRIQPVSQVLQEYDEMSEVRGKFEQFMKLKGSEKIQMLLRVGRGDSSFHSPRRPLEKLLVN